MHWLKFFWLKTIHAKILQTFLTYFFTCLTVILVLTTLVDLAFEATAAPFSELTAVQRAHVLFGNWPVILNQLMPFCVLLSTMLTYTSWCTHYELLACQTIGISTVRFAVPIFFCTALLGAVFYYNQSYALNYAKNGFSAKAAEPNLQWSFFQGRLFHFDVNSQESARPKKVLAYQMAEDGSIKRTQTYTRPQLENNTWVAKKYSQRTFNPNAYGETPDFENLNLSTEHSTTTLNTNWLQEPFSKIIQEYHARKDAGLSTTLVLQAGLNKAADILFLFTMVLLALPLVQLSPRQGQLGRNLGLAILLGFVSWMSDQLFNFAGSFNQWPMWFSAFGSSLCFGSAALFFLHFQRLRYLLNSLVLHLFKKLPRQSF